MKQQSILVQKADRLAHLVYGLSKKFPKEEQFGLTSQIRRAAVSVVLNIIEGFARQGRREYKHFLEISYGSLKETKYLLYFSYTEKYLTKNEYENGLNLSEEIGKMPWSTMQTIKKNC